jgi:hypothetical protein
LRVRTPSVVGSNPTTPTISSSRSSSRTDCGTAAMRRGAGWRCSWQAASLRREAEARRPLMRPRRPGRIPPVWHGWCYLFSKRASETRPGCAPWRARARLHGVPRRALVRSVRNFARGVALLVALAFAPVAYAQPAGEDAVGVPSFQEGDIITLDAVDRLQPYLPPAFWANRDFFFYEGMKLEIGPSYRDYAPADVYVAATKRFAGQAEIGPDRPTSTSPRRSASPARRRSAPRAVSRATPPASPSRRTGSTARETPRPGRRSSGTSTDAGTETGPGRSSTTRTGTGARSFRSSTRGRRRRSSSPSARSPSIWTRAAATSSEARSARPPSVSR